MTRRNGSGPRSERLEGRRLLASSGTLISQDFTSTAWQQTPGALSTGVTATLVQGGYGTIDTEGSTTTSGALRLTVDSAPTTPWSADLTSGQLAVTNTITKLGLLTLAFSLSASQAKPVRVVVKSYDTSGNVGALETTISPAVAYSYQRYALDLSTMKATGSGTFDPTASKVSFDLEMNSANGWTIANAAQLRLDNVNYAKPAYYVSPSGSDYNNGLTETTAFRTPQKALEISDGVPRVQPGDIVVLMAGNHATQPYDYQQVTSNTGAIHFTKGGTPAAWVTVKNYPGQSPTIYNEAWNTVLVGRGSSTSTSTAAALGYIEVRGLHLIGDSLKVGPRSAPDGNYDPANAALYNQGNSANNYAQYLQHYDSATGTVTGTLYAKTNGNGISIDGRYETNKPHDIRFADNVVEQMAGAGIGAGDCDRVQIENNVVQDNCYWDIYATSGISVLSAYNFDGTSGSVTRLVRNNVTSGNIHKQIWYSHGDYSDGNGIIIDINKYAAVKDAGGNITTPARACVGRTLVTNNVSFDNGGSGIHAYSSDHVDIVNNVAYLNSASVHLNYGQIFASSASDIRIYNNIAVAPTTVSSEGKQKPINSGTASFFQGNVWYGGTQSPVLGTNDIKSDPKFVNATVDKALANFRLQSTSPALNRGTTTAAPYLDLAGNVRYANPDSGAYEFVPAAPTAIALTAASDTGTAGDNKTNLNNATTASMLSFNVSGTLSGAVVNLYAGTNLIGSATASGTTTTVTTNGTVALPDGLNAITAVQVLSGDPSAVSAALGITVDTVGTTLSTVVVDDGTAQRSRVRKLTLTFAEPVTLTAAGITVTNTTTGAAAPFTLSASGGNTVYTLAFAGTSLDDGVYTLSLPAVAATDAAGNGLAGGDRTFSFHRLYGDMNGDRSVSISDFNAFAPAFGSPSSSPNFVDALDYNADGSISISDFNQFASRFGTSLPSYTGGLIVQAVVKSSSRRV